MFVCTTPPPHIEKSRSHCDLWHNIERDLKINLDHVVFDMSHSALSQFEVKNDLGHISL